MQSLARAVLLSMLLLLMSFGAEVGDTISNSADIYYHISGQDRNITTNEVNTTVVQTDANISFLTMIPISGEPTRLEHTKYLDSSGVWQNMPDAIPPYGSVLHPPADIETQPTIYYAQTDLVIITVEDKDMDTNASRQDTLEINITDPSSGDIETIQLLETNLSSGLFTGYIQTVATAVVASDGKLSVSLDDHIVAIYIDNGIVKEVVVEATIIAVKFRLKVTKKQSKDKAAIGDFLKYTITVQNIGNIPLSNILIEDKQPYGVKYQKWSFQVEGQKIAPTLSPDGKLLSIYYAKLEPKETITLSYVALVTAGIIDKKAINQAWASAPYGGVSNVASTTLEIVEDLYRSRGFIVGQVYDANVPRDTNHTADTNASSPHGKYGIEGIKIFMEDGRFVITDKNGKYHFQDIKNGTHVLQIDEDSLQGKYRLALCRDNTRTAGSKRSQFVDIYHASLARADFCLEDISKTLARGRFSIRVQKKSKTKMRVHLSISSDENMIDPEVFLALSEGLVYTDKSIKPATLEPILKKDILSIKMRHEKSASFDLNLSADTNPDKEIRGLLYYDTQDAKNERSDITQLAFTTKPLTGDINVTYKATYDPSKVADENDTDIDMGGLPMIRSDFNWTKPTHAQTMPKYTPKSIKKLGEAYGIIWPPKDWIPSFASTRVAMLTPKGGSADTKLNGRKINPLNYEGIIVSADSKTQIIHYKGVDLKQKNNLFVTIIKDAKGKVVANSKREVYVESGPPAKIEFLPKYSWLYADGKNSPIIAVRFFGSSGHPMRSGMTGAYVTDPNHEAAKKSNDKGMYTIDSEGIAYIKLKPTTIAGEAKLRFGNSGSMAITVKLEPYMRDWILVGFGKGTIGYSTIHGNMEALNHAHAPDGWYNEGRLAFYAKGAIQGKWLLTMVYDSGRKKGDRELFDAIDPDKYYTLYNDTTKQENETASTKKLYLKLEREAFVLLYGDYKTQLHKTDLSKYERVLTGLRSEYSGSNIHTVAFQAETSNLFYRDELRGDGTPGYYHLSQKDIIKGSDTISIEVRDRYREQIVLETKTLVRYEDYDIDYDNGTLYFKTPIYQSDKAFNPQYIVATYELDGEGKGYNTYGVSSTITSDDGNYSLGGTIIKEETGRGENSLYGIDTTIQIGAKTTLHAEYARTKTIEDDNATLGDASEVDITYKDSNFTANAYYRKQDDSFGLGQLSSALSATRKVGLDTTKKLSKEWKLNSTLYQDSKYDDEQNKTDQNVFQTTADYDNDKWGGTAGYRYARATDENATNQIISKLTRKFTEKNTTVWISYDQTIGSSTSKTYPQKAAIGAEYKHESNASAFMIVERSKTDTGSRWQSKVGGMYKYDVNGTIKVDIGKTSDDTGDLWTTSLGADYKYGLWKDTELKLSSGYSYSDDNHKQYNAMGITRKIVLNDKWKIDAGYEKGLTFSSQDKSDGNYDAINLGAGYTGELYSSDMKAGYKHDDSNDKVNLGAGVYIKKSDATGLAFAVGYHNDWSSDDSQTRKIEGKLAFVYRPEMTDWIVLDRMDVTDDKTIGSTDSIRTQKFINNLHLNWQPIDKWTLGLQYGLKHVIDHIDDTEYSSWTDLVGIDAKYDVGVSWSLGLQGSVLHSYTGNNMEYGWGAFIDTTPIKNTVFTIGYNIKGFSDSDFSMQNYHYQGPYIQFKMKFDQNTVKDIARDAVRR